MEVGVSDGIGNMGNFFFTAASAKSSGFSLIEDFLQENGGPL